MSNLQETKQKELPEIAGDSRDKQGRFIKGQSGNPNGRIPGTGLNLTSLLKQHLEQKPEGKKEYYKDLFIKTLLHKALIEKDIQALKLIINYCDGLPTQKIEGNLNLYKLNIVRDKEENGEDDKTS